MNRKSLTLIEALAVLCIILILIGVFAGYARITLRVAREVALRNELNNIRMSIQHYWVTNSKLPKDLFSLVNQDFTIRSRDGTILTKKYLQLFRIDEEENLLDPFLNMYYYSAKEGRVFSGTKGYEGW